MKNQTELLQLSNHQALGDYVVVVPAEINEGGVTTRATQFEDRPEVGVVVSHGPDAQGIAEGNVVFFGKYSHVQVTHGGVTYLIMRAEDIFVVA